MQYRKLGNTGLEVSEISLGTWAFASSAYGDVDRSEAVRTIHEALDMGITLFDTAPLYGHGDEDGVAETILGEALGEGRRDNVLISTKFGRRHTGGMETAFHKAGVIESVDASLRRLGTDRIDVLFFHSPFGADQIHDDVWEGLDQLKQAGKINVIGHSISLFQDTQGMAREWALDRRIQAIQVVISLMNRESRQLIMDLGETGVGVVGRECLANGFLTDAVTADTVFPENNLNSRYSREEIAERVAKAAEYDFLREGPIRTRAQVAMRWVLDQPGISTVLTGASNRAQMLDCAAASDAEAFTAESLARAAELHEKDFAAA